MRSIFLAIMASVFAAMTTIAYFQLYKQKKRAATNPSKPAAVAEAEVSPTLPTIQAQETKAIYDVRERSEPLPTVRSGFDPMEEYREEKQADIENLIEIKSSPSSKETKATLNDREKQAQIQKAFNQRKERLKLQEELLQKRKKLQKLKEALESRAVITGEPYPYKVVIHPGWKILEWEKEFVFSWKDEVTMTIDTGPWVSNQLDWAVKSIQDVQKNYPNMVVTEKSLESMGYRDWHKYVFSEVTPEDTPIPDSRELMLLTHSGDRGSYRVIIGGKGEDLDKHVAEMNKVLKSFRFPADNFKPENHSEVRIYINGVRQFF